MASAINAIAVIPIPAAATPPVTGMFVIAMPLVMVTQLALVIQNVLVIQLAHATQRVLET
jgi:hypothetical protein